MKLTWEASLDIGIEWQDRQHRELFNHLSALLEAVRAGKGSEELTPFLDFVDRYANVHFVAEEKEMERSEYPDRCRHVLEHRVFAQQLEDLRAKLGKGVQPTHLTEALHRGYDWLRRHVGGSDRELGQYLLSPGSRQGVEEVDT